MGEILGREIPGAEAVNLDAWEAELARHLDGLGADAAAPARLARYHRLLCEWNARMNLTGDTDFAVALYRHYLDSLAPLRLEGLFAHGARVIDVGSGAGFPGLPLAIIRPDLQVTLLDALQKRISFLAAVVEELGLTHVRLVHARAEDGARNPEHRERYDLAVARAVAPLPVLCELMLPFVAVGGRMFCYKGPAAQDELEAGGRAARMLGGGALEVLPADVPGQPDWRHIIVACRKKEKPFDNIPEKPAHPAVLRWEWEIQKIEFVKNRHAARSFRARRAFAVERFPLLLRQESGGLGRNDIDMGAPVRPRMSRGGMCGLRARPIR